jgi:hypothetical protein
MPGWARGVIAVVVGTLLVVVGALMVREWWYPPPVRLLIPRNTVAAYLPVTYWFWDEWARPVVRLPDGEVVQLPPKFWNQTPHSEPEVFRSWEECVRRRVEILTAFASEEPSNARWRLGHSRCTPAP